MSRSGRRPKGVARGVKRSAVVPLEVSENSREATAVSPEAPGGQFAWPWRWVYFNASNRFAPHAGEAVRAALIERLCGGVEEYSKASTELGRANQPTLALLRQVTVNSSNRARMARGVSFEDDAFVMDDIELETTDDPCDEEPREQPSPSNSAARAVERKWFLRRRRKDEFIVSIAARQHNQNVKAFVIVVLSLMGLMTGMSRSCFALLCAVNALYSYNWTKELALDFGSAMKAKAWATESSSAIGFAVGDNCAYMAKKTFEHRDTRGQFIETVNWLSVPIRRLPSGVMPEIGGGAATRENDEFIQ